MRRQVKIVHHGIGNATIEVDGREIQNVVRGYAVFAESPQDWPTVTLDISGAGFPVFEGQAEVGVTQEVGDALVALGWKPPEDTDLIPPEMAPATDRIK
jgi:hypothetical protein